MINIKTAKALGLTISQAVLAIADEELEGFGPTQTSRSISDRAGCPVFACAERTEPPPHLILSKTSAGGYSTMPESDWRATLSKSLVIPIQRCHADHTDMSAHGP